MPEQLARLIGARAVLVPYSAFDNDVLGPLFLRRAGVSNLRPDRDKVLSVLFKSAVCSKQSPASNHWPREVYIDYMKQFDLGRAISLG